jgi:Fe-S cluster assembly ATPase SufC
LGPNGSGKSTTMVVKKPNERRIFLIIEGNKEF